MASLENGTVKVPLKVMGTLGDCDAAACSCLASSTTLEVVVSSLVRARVAREEKIVSKKIETFRR
eukprot:scaffold4504_cov116-Isochrysis_galbana.AAC.15